MNCPSDDMWLREATGDVTLNEASSMRAHARDCAQCRAVRASVRGMLEHLQTPPKLETQDDDFVARVMRACEGEEPQSHETSWGESLRRRFVWGTFGVALAAVVTLGLLRSKPGASDELTARGNSVQSNAPPEGFRSAEVDVYVVRDEALSSVSDSVLGPADRLVVRAGNRGAEPVFFGCFVLDAAREVHWVFPAYTEEGRAPELSMMGPGRTMDLLPESVGLDDVAEGALTVVSLVFGHSMNVLDVERRIAAQPGAEVGSIFPEARSQTWSATWQAH